MSDKKISELSSAITLDGTEILLLSQSGSDKNLKLSVLASYISSWMRPIDWLAMPASAANKIDVLAAVTNDASNYVALSATAIGGFTVDWGDGNITTHTSAATAQHFYDYADTDLGALTTRGYKQALIKITPTTGGNAITAFDLSKKHSRTNLNAYSNPWLDIQVNCPSATSMAYRGGVEARMVERINIVAIGAITTLASAFFNCSSLQSVSFPAGSLVSVTTLSSAFLSCYALQSVSFPSGSLASVTSFANAFQNCSSLQSVNFPAGSLVSVTNLDSAFLSCSSLQSVSFPSGSLASVTILATTFQSCSSLQGVSFPAGSLVSVTTLSSAFNACSSLQSVSFPAGSLALVAVTANAFASCPSLARIQNCGIPISFSVASAKLAGAQLDEIYTALPVAVGQTITVSTNHGTPDDTPSIATGKGWTVTGS